jgi:uncharacterized protein YicC (UPF0701 family)
LKELTAEIARTGAAYCREDYRVKLEARLKELLGDTTVDESRIVMEAAVYADRSDITEELDTTWESLRSGV